MINPIYSDLAGQRVLITGGASGIGKAIVEAFCAQKAEVFFVDLNAEAGKELCQNLSNSSGSTPIFKAINLLNISELQGWIQAIYHQHGPIRVLVNNAANDARHKIEDVTLEYWDERMATNLRHFFFAAQAVLPQMKENGGGSIINYGSVSWMLKQTGMPAYTTAKSAVWGFTRSLANEGGVDRIRVNMLVPGWVMTERQLTLHVTSEGLKQLEERQCLPDHVQPEDLAQATLFLASDASRMITAQQLVVDGGWT
jgi:NAD(P)-dependent dehydrogenase (short-subunit alcohol dehydrogenase family)